MRRKQKKQERNLPSVQAQNVRAGTEGSIVFCYHVDNILGSVCSVQMAYFSVKFSGQMGKYTKVDFFTTLNITIRMCIIKW